MIRQSILEHAKSMFFCNLSLSITWFAIHQFPWLCNKEQVQMKKIYIQNWFLFTFLICFGVILNMYLWVYSCEIFRRKVYRNDQKNTYVCFRHIWFCLMSENSSTALLRHLHLDLSSLIYVMWDVYLKKNTFKYYKFEVITKGKHKFFSKLYKSNCHFFQQHMSS